MTWSPTAPDDRRLLMSACSVVATCMGWTMTRAAPPSSRETSRRSSTSSCIRRARSLTSSAARESSSSRPAAVMRPVSGVRSSCAKSAVNRCSVSMRSDSRATAESTASAKSATSSWPLVMTSPIFTEVSPAAICLATSAPRVSRPEIVPIVSAPKPPTSSAPMTDAMMMVVLDFLRICSYSTAEW